MNIDELEGYKRVVSDRVFDAYYYKEKHCCPAKVIKKCPKSQTFVV